MCKCFSGWVGENCLHVDDQICAPGSAGESCDRCAVGAYNPECSDECDDVTTCNANGRCIGRTGECDCYEGWAGHDCSMEIVLTQDHCSEDGSTCLTSCPAGFTGETCYQCEIDAYTGNCIDVCNIFSTCNGHGRCGGDTGQCKLHDAFSSDMIRTPQTAIE